MRLFIDIDGVLARPDEVAIARLCNEAWQLGVDEERLCQCKTLNDFQALPELITRREERGQQRSTLSLAGCALGRMH